MSLNVPCPVCGRVVSPAGEITLVAQVLSIAREVTAPLYQCPDCTVEVSVAGKCVRVRLHFLVDAYGVPIDPLTMERFAPFPAPSAN